MANIQPIEMKNFQRMLVGTIRKEKSKDYGKIYSKLIVVKLLIIKQMYSNWRILNDIERENGNLYKIVRKCNDFINYLMVVGFTTMMVKSRENRLRWMNYSHLYWCKNGIKVGRWDIMYEGQQLQSVGQYDQEGNEIKIGKWVDLDEGFETYKLVTYQGEYNINGMKEGNWEIMHNKSIHIQIYKYLIRRLEFIQRKSVVDHMNQKEIRKRLESGLNWMKNFNKINKSLIVSNMM
ncbi:unnamed protein product [Paramecium sonneborni]|uniref:Uncharacterized protein n=1 Tax=Paramecium sonneborni TaxID=65129 RepID=A0A8S1RMW2_9CILI|nr:unnamed protein product [Paramecium sonneborni]